MLSFQSVANKCVLVVDVQIEENYELTKANIESYKNFCSTYGDSKTAEFLDYQRSWFFRGLGQELIAKENYVMRRISIALLVVLLLGTVVVPQKAGAAVLQFNTRGAWEAAVSGAIVEEDFNDGVLIPLISSINSTNGSVGGGTFNDLIDDSPVATTTFNFSKSLTAFGAEWDLTPGGPGIGLNLFADGMQIGTSPTIANTFAGEFFGFVLTGGETFNSLLIAGAGQPSGFYETYKLDNVAVSAVPIPAAMPLFLSALAAMGFFSWFRNKWAGQARRESSVSTPLPASAF